ncbi:porin [Paraburkholderia phenoliruptrix]|uniref:porin n=1 Tax=Paraburkholderia phenoliruptrix TaxID=252970 RepID=UPI0034CD2D35
MKRAFVAIAMSACGSARAQSSVTLYGIIDAGATYTNRVSTSTGKGSVVQFTSGSAQGSRWGLRGSEDLGGGTKTLFVLENGFNVGTGALGQGGLEFGRQAYVGLAGNYGTLTLGRQYDFIGEVFPAFAIGANTPAGVLAWSLPAYASGGNLLDNRVWGVQTNNAVKYRSPTINGFSFGAMYGFGNVAGSMGRNSSSNYVATYDNGPFSAALAYMSIHNATASANSTEYAGGASYAFRTARLFALVTDVQLSSGMRPRATTFEGGAVYELTPVLFLGGGFQYQQRNSGIGSANQLVTKLNILCLNVPMYISFGPSLTTTALVPRRKRRWAVCVFRRS